MTRDERLAREAESLLGMPFRDACEYIVKNGRKALATKIFNEKHKILESDGALFQEMMKNVSAFDVKWSLEEVRVTLVISRRGGSLAKSRKMAGEVVDIAKSQLRL